ncbi:manganese/zinc/iron transport system ATP-binding protein [Lishizhenia tianjinensis]|uniref:Manganese/zinc/iron transport system ATP-binding protein n=1 Tax=Lishizhenia tianjinensis TaxID=477690 RepID=A0A1I6YPR0_9FLAO|nr:metal ABC transporter ATP-binding protein [Lishizhenia tianjinensis]SFT52318.1 manganese/zinc/iron transport system ATP-binding protein [Lishizhenia tianjinensis]
MISLEAHNLTVAYDKVPVLWDIDFELPTGKIIGIIGPNGSGKTTLLKTIMGLIKPASGYVKVFEQDLDEVRQRVAYVPQRESVDWDFPASVQDVVEMGRYRKNSLFRRLTQTDKEIVANAIEKVKLTAFKDRQISQLSGGQQQRVFIARALAQGADIFFMDEPFVGVDATTETAILDLLTTMRDEGKTVVIVHHDLQTVSGYFDHLVLLNTRVIACGPTAEVLTQENLSNAYGGQLTLLSKIQSIIKEKEFPIREKGFEKR